MNVKEGQYLEKNDATMYPNTIPLLKSSYTLNKLVNNKLAPTDIVSKTIFMDGMPQVSASIYPWGGRQYRRTCVVKEASTELLPDR